MENISLSKLLSLLSLLLVLLQMNGLFAANSDSLRTLFADPLRQYTDAPLWVWNDQLTEEQIVSTMTDLASQNVRQVFVHPRPGLMTPYLSDEWFHLWNIALREAERLDMNVWIYDENSYPSGFAGGLVPDAMPESQGRGLVLKEQEETPPNSDNLIAVYRINETDYENITGQVRSQQNLPKDRYLVASLSRAGTSPWFGGKYYVDLLYPGVTQKFIELTLEPYRKNIGGQFGKRVPGTFTDEPHLRPADGLPWTDDLPARFQNKWGYSLLDNLPGLALPIGDWKQLRHNYYQLLMELFIDRWARPLYQYCQDNHLEFTGHYWEHDWPNCTSVPDNMAMYSWHQRPAIDILMNQYNEDTHAQFGNARVVLELASAAHQMGYPRTLCEAYGAGGWDLRFEDMKRIADWLFALGVNTIDEHLSYITLRGARKRDHPQSFSYHEPWWDAYHVMATYCARLSFALSQGRQINKILLLEPTTSVWLYQPDSSRRDEIGNTFQKMVVDLAQSQVAFDIGCEDIMARNGSVADGQLQVGRCNYDTIVIPPLTENLNAKTAELFETYLNADGIIYCCGTPPSLIDGAPAPQLAAIWKNKNFKRIEPADIIATLLNRSTDGFFIRRNENDTGILYHHRRHWDDGELLFLVNTSIEASSSGKIESSAQSIQKWDAENGTISDYAFHTAQSGLTAEFSLPPCGSLLLFLSQKPASSSQQLTEKSISIPAMASTTIRRLQPNVLTLDYVDITAGGETKQNIYFYQANRFAFQKNGLPQNPWDSSVQFRDGLITTTFPPDSGFEASYSFTLAEKIPQPLTIVIERPDLYQITCNGQPVTATPGQWWLDKSFGKIDITAAAQLGKNTVTIQAAPMTIYHELEPAYLLGDFALESAESGFTVVPDRPLQMNESGWNQQGHPFYADGFSYSQQFDLPQPQGRFCVQLSKWYGSVARVKINGKTAGYIYAQPWQCEVTQWIQKGINTIDVEVVGTLKNTLGPHHGNPPLGMAWPGMFQNGPQTGPPPGNQYHTVRYGLFDPFELVQFQP